MSNPYLTLTEFKGSGIANMPLDTDDTRLLRLLEDVSRQIDKWCQRVFYLYLQAMEFSGNNGIALYLPADLVAVTTLKEDTNRDAVFETTWATADYDLWPYNADPAGGRDNSTPYRRLEVNLRTNGNQDVFLVGQRMYELTGKWGYWERTEDTGANTNEGGQFSASDTTLKVDNGEKIFIGDTLLIESEQLYVTDKPLKDGPDLTVIRGVNGTTAAAHDDGKDISRYLYPGPIVEATLMQASRLWTRRVAGFAAEVGFSESGGMVPVKGLDRDVKEMLKPYQQLVG